MNKIVLLIGFLLISSLWNCTVNNDRIVLRENNEVIVDLSEINAAIEADSITVILYSPLDTLDSILHIDTTYIDTVLIRDSLPFIPDTLYFQQYPRIGQELYIRVKVYSDDILIASLEGVNEFDHEGDVPIMVPALSICFVAGRTDSASTCIDSLRLANSAPKIFNLPLTIITVGDTYSYNPLVHDRENDSVFFSILDKPEWLDFTVETGSLFGIPSIEDVGTSETIKIFFNDKINFEEIAPFQITVNNNPQKPVISEIPSQSVALNDAFAPISLNEYVFDARYNDSLLTWNIVSINSDSTHIQIEIDSQTNVVTFEPVTLWQGNDTIALTVTNPLGGAASKKIILTVFNNQQNSLTIRDIPDQTINLGESFASINLTKYATDSSLGISWLWENGEHIEVVDNTGLYIVTIQPDDPFWIGTEEITFRARTDFNEISTTANFTIKTDNIARGKSVSQLGLEWNAGPELAIDGNIDGEFSNGSVSQTEEGINKGDGKPNPWWEIDLGQETFVTGIELFNRTGEYSDKLKNYYILVSSSPFDSYDPEVAATNRSVSIIKDSLFSAPPDSIFYTINRSARYIRVQLRSVSILSLAEVKIYEKKLHPIVLNPGTKYVITTDNSSGGSALAVDVYGGNPVENIGTWEAVGGQNQQWLFDMRPASDFFRAKNLISQLCMEIDVGTYLIEHRECDMGQDLQFFYLEFDGNNHYIRSAFPVPTATGVYRYLTLSTDRYQPENPLLGRVSVTVKDTLPSQQHLLIKVAPVEVY